MRVTSSVDLSHHDQSPTVGPLPHRRLLIGLEVFVVLAGLMGVIQLWAGIATPPSSTLPPMLSGWVLPGFWLLATVPLPAAVAAFLALRRSPWTPQAVLIGAATMAVELVVQIPFLGLNPFQAVFGAVALVLAALALRARRLGWR